MSDIERSIGFYTDIIGLKLQGRTEIDDVHEAHLAADEGGGRLQLAERYNGGQPIDHGFALWKIYMQVDDCAATHAEGRRRRLRVDDGADNASTAGR